jgi:hypothetical protein
MACVAACPSAICLNLVPHRFLVDLDLAQALVEVGNVRPQKFLPGLQGFLPGHEPIQLLFDPRESIFRHVPSSHPAGRRRYIVSGTERKSNSRAQSVR